MFAFYTADSPESLQVRLILMNLNGYENFLYNGCGRSQWYNFQKAQEIAVPALKVFDNQKTIYHLNKIL